MSSHSLNSSEAENHPNNTESRDHVGESLEQRLKAIDLNDPQSNAESPKSSRIKLSARDLLEKLKRRRLEVSQIIFTAGGHQASKGGHGEVVVATLALNGDSSSELGRKVAVKKFLFSGDVDEEKFLRTFVNELRVLDNLDHPNIVKLVGFVEDMKLCTAWLVFPWEANGNVREFLLSGKWELPARVSLIKDVAFGLEYLHSQKPPIRHGDLKSLNILVNSDHRAVITDFGSARIQTEARELGTTSSSIRGQAASTDSNPTQYAGSPEVTLSTTNAELTLTGPSWSFRWAAPEVLNEEEPSLASDIWALGWIAWEVVTDNYPFPEVKTNQLITIKVIKGLLPSLYDDDQLSQIGQLCHLMMRCWKPEPKERPSVAECRRALQWLPSAIPAARNNGASQIRSAALLVQIGIMNSLRYQYKEALKFYDEGLAIARSAGDKVMTAHALFLSATCHQMFRDYDKAEECCKEALVICESVGNSFGRANALHRLGETYQARFNHTQAEECFNEALAICKDFEDSLGQANALYRLGEIHQARLNDLQAEDSFHRALTLSTSIEDPLGQANALLSLGEIHKARLDYDQAEEYLNEALPIHTSIGNSFGQATTLQRLGEIHQARLDYDQAEKYLNEALPIYTSIGNSLRQANTLQRLGEIHQARSNYAKAESSFTEALAIFTRAGSGIGRANALVGLGEVLIRQARYSEAKSYLDDAGEVSEQIGYEWAQDHSKELLSGVLEEEKSSAER